MLSSVGFAGGTAATDLLIAVAMLRELNATGRRKVFDEAPTGFVPTKWRGYLEEARRCGNPTAYRHYWELCVLLGLRDGLRTGDVVVLGSRRYADPAAYLLTPQQWEPQRAEFCRPIGESADPARALADAVDELHASVSELEKVLADGEGPVRLDDDGNLVISPLTAEDVPAEAAELEAELTEMLPFAPIVSLPIELDKRYGKDSALTGADREHAEVSMLALHLLQSAMVRINTPLLQDVLEDPEFHDLVGETETAASAVSLSESWPRDSCRAYDWTGAGCSRAEFWLSSVLAAPLRQLSAIAADTGSGKISSAPLSTPSKMAPAADCGETFGMSQPRFMSVSTGPGRTACTATPCPASSARSDWDSENAAALEIA